MPSRQRGPVQITVTNKARSHISRLGTATSTRALLDALPGESQAAGGLRNTLCNEHACPPSSSKSFLELVDDICGMPSSPRFRRGRPRLFEVGPGVGRALPSVPGRGPVRRGRRPTRLRRAFAAKLCAPWRSRKGRTRATIERRRSGRVPCLEAQRHRQRKLCPVGHDPQRDVS